MKNYEEIIKINLKQELETNAKSKSQIAKELGITRPTLSQYLSGRVLPSLTTFAQLCDILDVSADDVLGLK